MYALLFCVLAFIAAAYLLWFSRYSRLSNISHFSPIHPEDHTLPSLREHVHLSSEGNDDSGVGANAQQQYMSDNDVSRDVGATISPDGVTPPASTERFTTPQQFEDAQSNVFDATAQLTEVRTWEDGYAAQGLGSPL